MSLSDFNQLQISASDFRTLGGSQSAPTGRLLQIASEAPPFGIHYAQFVLRHGKALLGSTPEPFGCLGVISGYPEPIFINQTQCRFRSGISLLSRFANQPCGSNIIRR